MSVFSDVLNSFKEEKNIKVQPLARYCGVERSTIYKFINDKINEIEEKDYYDLIK